MGSFASGFKMGGDMYDSSEESKRQKVLDDRATTAYNQGQEDRARAVGIRSQLDDAYKAQAGLANGTVDGNTADFSGTSPAADQGPVQQAQMAPVVGLRSPGSDPSAPAPGLVRTPATQMDRLNAASTIANLKQDDVGIARIGAERQVLTKNASDRTFLSQLETMSKNPDQADAYQKQIAPVMEALNGHDGIPANYHYDPKTRSVVQTPYGSVDPKTGQATYGAPQQMPFLTVASAALAMKNLTDENGGDPAAAAAQLKTMGDGERDRRLKEADSSVRNATSLSYASSQQQQVDNTDRHNRVSEGIQAANARNSGGGDKKDDPKLIAQLNQSALDYQNAKTPEEQEKHRRVYNSVESQIMTARGKGVALKENRPNAGSDPTKREEFITKYMANSGKGYPEASEYADRTFGNGPGQGAVNPGLQKLNGAGAPSATTRPAAAPVVQDNSIPSPPPQFRNVGLTQVANPQFTQWQQTYGDEFARQQADESAVAQQRLRGYNPYTPNRVR